MYDEITNIPGNNSPKHYSGSPGYKSHQRQTMLPVLAGELYRTNGRMQTIRENINEKHTIYFPLHKKSGKQNEIIFA